MSGLFEHTQTVTSNKKSGTIEFRLKNVQQWRHEDVFQGKIFDIAGIKWRVILCRAFPSENTHEKFTVQLLYCNAKTIAFDVSITFQNQLSRYRSYVQTYRSCHATPFSAAWFSDYADYDTIISPTAGFIEDDTIVMTISLENFRNVKTSRGSHTIGDDMNLICVEIISDDSIRENMRERCSYGLASVKRRRYRNFKCNSAASNFKMADSRMWLCERTARGVVLLQILDELPIGTKLGDLRVDVVREQSWLTLFREKHHPEGPISIIADDDVIIFCKLYDPEECSLTYIGFLHIAKSKRCLDLITRLADLVEVTVGIGFDVYIEEGDLSVRHLSNFYTSVFNAGLVSGSVVVIRPRFDGQVVSEEMVRSALNTIYLEGIEVSAEEERRRVRSNLPIQASQEENEEYDKCVVCMDAARTSGFVHGTTSHRCVCEPCAMIISQQPRPRCPMCRAVVQHTIFKMF